jgi:hypothetical protein
MLWCALNPDGYSHSAIRSAPVQESHPITPFFPDRQQANVCPRGTDDSTAGPPGGWVLSCVSTSRKTRHRINLRSERFGSLPGQAEVGIPSYSDEQKTSSRPQQQHALLFGTAELAYECRQCELQSNLRPLGERHGTESIPSLYREKLPYGAPGTSQLGPLPCRRPNYERSTAR